jgi:hypothetical protein
VLDVQRKRGVPPAYRQSADSARFRYAYDEYEFGTEVERLYHGEGRSLRETAAALGVDVTTLRRRMERLGLRVRPPGPRRGRPRGPYRTALPPCAVPGCPTRVRSEGESMCGECRRSARRRRRLGAGG